MPAVISGDTLIPLALVFGGLGALIGAVMAFTKTSLLGDLNSKSITKHKEEQDEINKEIFTKLQKISEDVAVIKRILQHMEKTK